MIALGILATFSSTKKSLIFPVVSARDTFYLKSQRGGVTDMSSGAGVLQHLIVNRYDLFFKLWFYKFSSWVYHI